MVDYEECGLIKFLDKTVAIDKTNVYATGTVDYKNSLITDVEGGNCLA